MIFYKKITNGVKADMIFVAGCTSQIGEVLIEKLSEKGYKIRCLVRQNSKIDILKNNPNIEFVVGDLSNVNSLMDALRDVDYVINVAGIWYSQNILKALDKLKVKVKKTIFVGSTSRFQKVNSEDKNELEIVRKMLEAEEFINSSEQNTIILRPTMLYGINKDKNIYKLITIMKKYHVLPIIGKGVGIKQPVYVGDVADAIIACMLKDNLIKEEYNIPGKNQVEYNVMINDIKKNLREFVLIFHVPVSLARLGFSMYKKINPKSTVNKAMINRVNKDFVFDYEKAKKDFGYDPLSFQDGVKKQTEFLRTNGCIK